MRNRLRGFRFRVPQKARHRKVTKGTMAVQLFGAIDVGSYEIGLTISELSRKNGIHEIDHVSHRINLGTDTFRTGKISYEHVRELKELLTEYRRIMDSYGVTECKAYGTSAIREMVNSTVVLSGIEQVTGIHIDVLSNSEQRFLDYKSIAAKGAGFTKVIEKPTAIVDIGGSSIQISLFDEDRLVETQNLKLGVLRLYDQIRSIDAGSARLDYVIGELVNSQLRVFQNLYLGDRRIRNIIVVDDYIAPILQNRTITGCEPGYIDSAKFAEVMTRVRSVNAQEAAKRLGMSDDNIPLLYLSGRMLECIVDAFGAEMIWAPGVTLCDGMVYEFAEKKGLKLPEHDFEADIMSIAENTARRYRGLPERQRELEEICVKIFDATKKYHGLGSRERLLLRIAATLHDCGKYISMTNVGGCSYDIIMATEIIGLSHIEREIIANVVKFNHESFVYYRAQQSATDLDRNSYLIIAKLTAILRLANGLDRSHQQKFHDIRVSVRDDQLRIAVPGDVDLTMEKGLFVHRADFFEEVYGIRPVIRQMKKR